LGPIRKLRRRAARLPHSQLADAAAVHPYPL